MSIFNHYANERWKRQAEKMILFGFPRGMSAVDSVDRGPHPEHGHPVTTISGRTVYANGSDFQHLRAAEDPETG